MDRTSLRSDLCAPSVVRMSIWTGQKLTTEICKTSNTEIVYGSTIVLVGGLRSMLWWVACFLLWTSQVVAPARVATFFAIHLEF